jgi:hypothetical protein
MLKTGREVAMARLAEHEADNVVPLRRGHRVRHEQEPARDLADALRSFDRLERCAVALQSGPLGMAHDIDGIDWPIVTLQVELPSVQRWLDQLARINVATWPDTRWVLKLSSARAAATLSLDAVTQSLYRTPPGTGPLDGQLTANIQEFMDALHRLRQLIVEQYPESLRAPQ